MLNELALGIIIPFNKKISTAVVPFRCWPIDMDVFMHMNNASYLRIAELARWRLLPQTGMLAEVVKKGWVFLAVENSVIYKKPILPFQKFVVEISIHTTKDKWIHYCHKFLQHPKYVKAGEEPIEYARVNLMAVIKQKDGKTVRPSAMKELSEWNKLLLIEKSH